MNSFFFSQGEDFAVPPRVYARLIEIEPAEYVLFDAVNAIFFDNLLEATDGFTPPARPGTTNARAALSYVWNNTHKHPSTASLSALSGVNWSIGTQAACLDERRTGQCGRQQPGRRRARPYQARLAVQHKHEPKLQVRLHAHPDSIVQLRGRS